MRNDDKHRLTETQLRFEAPTLSVLQRKPDALRIRICTYVLTAAFILMPPVQRLPQRPTPPPQAEERVQRLIDSLPTDDATRLNFEEGSRGDGVHYPWMDLMHVEGVRRALIVVTFDWDGRPKNLKAVRTVYYNKYDSDCAQITDPARLESIRSNGLEQQVVEFANNRTAAMRWITIDNPRPHVRGVNKVYVLDDEWLPKPPTNFVDAGPDSGLVFPIGFFEDEAAVAQFASSQKKTKTEVDAALFEAVNSTDDSCVIRPLVAAGANVNPHNEYGTTPLSIAVEDGEANNVRALLAAGADPNVRDSEGKTPLWNAEQGHGRYYPSVVQILKQYGAKY